MKYIKLSDFIKIDQEPFICGAFLSRIMETNIDGKKYFYAYSKFKTSKYVSSNKFDFQLYAYQYCNELVKASGFDNWVIYDVNESSMELRYYIFIDINNFSKTNLYDYIYKLSVTSDWSLEYGLNEKKKEFIRGFSELRGSVDTCRPLLAQDYFYDSRKELKKSQILTDTMNIPINYCNFNSRELQPDYVSGRSKRNSQFRIDINYYARNIGFLNKYKALVYECSHHAINRINKNNVVYFDVPVKQATNIDVRFINYLNFYSDNIYSKDITEDLLKELRSQLKFDKKEIVEDDDKKRDKEVIAIFDRVSPNICAICGTKETFENKNSGHNDFEIHHVVPRYKGKAMDNIANLVKLCPTCHAMMKKGRALDDTQTRAIKKILSEHDEIYDFASNTMGIVDVDILSSEIQKILG